MTMLFRKLTNLDRDIIRQWIDDYAIHCDPDLMEGRVSVEEILTVWNSEKEKMFQLLGNELIIEKEISITKDKETMEDDMLSFLWPSRENPSAGETFRSNWEEFLWNTRTNYDDEVYYNLRHMIDVKTLISNQWNGEPFEIPLPNNKKYRVLNGHKAMKVLSKMASVYNIEGFEKFRIGHSQVLNDKKLKGHLCLSIHPMDFMTMSDNACDWGSCMSWLDDGDYRRGTVVMMNSPMVVVAYLKSKDDMYVGAHTDGSTLFWNNKRWRQLFIVLPETITAVKGYPIWNREIEENCLRWIKELAETNLGYEYLHEDPVEVNFSYDAAPDSNVVCINGKSYRFNFSCDTMYNDFAYKHCLFVGAAATEINDIFYSGPDTCMSCGRVNVYYDSESCLVCDDCHRVYRCACCGDSYNENELLEGPHGDLVCKWCYDNLPVCACCGEMEYSCDTEMVNLAFSEDEIARNYTISICNDCLYDYFIKKTRKYSYYDLYYILLEDCDEDLLNAFGIDDLEEIEELKQKNYFSFYVKSEDPWWLNETSVW